MFDANRDGLHECFLDRTVQVAISGHIAEPTVSEDMVTRLSTQGVNGVEFGWGCGVICRTELFPINLIAAIFHCDGISD